MSVFYQVKKQDAHGLSSSKPSDTNLLISLKAPRVGARVWVHHWHKLKCRKSVSEK